MTFKSRLLAVNRVVVLAPLALSLIAFCFVQLQEHLLRDRAERLLADFQSIRLHQSTWADAQALMNRWGAWGHYDGQCTSTDCDYTITLSDAVTDAANQVHSDRAWWWLRWIIRSYELLGGKGALLRIRFLVQDGTVWRSYVGLRLDVPPQTLNKDDDYGYWIGVSAKASDSLHQRYDPVHHRPVGPWVLGTDDQLAEHPNYKAGRPGGCEICLWAQVTFTPAISPEELERLTDYNLSCITRFHRCVNLPDVLPIARDWHFYPTTEPPYPEPPPPRPHPCAIPLLAVARDAQRILLVDVLSVEIKKGQFDGEPRDGETAKVRLVQTIKGTMPLTMGAVFTVQSFPRGSYTAESLVPGKRNIVVPWYAANLPSVELDSCGVFEDSPKAQEQLKRGFAQNDMLRHRDEFGGFW
ncbi:MAG TPA: hypothetical protein VFE06_05620 [Acidobacteriaceae bacterium]|nr:hypothetical protein [Acidobacteriaceae bacterium]